MVHVFSGGVTNMLLFEQVANHVRLLLAAMQMTSDATDHLRFAGWSDLAKRIGFHVLIEQLVRIRPGAVAWRSNQSQALGMRVDTA